MIGIDFGNQNAVISCAKRGGIDTLLNEGSKRATRTIVSFQGKQRFMGEAAVPLVSSNFKNTIIDVKRFVGKSWSDPTVQADIARCPNRKNFRELDGDRVGIEVSYQNEQMVLSAEDACAMVIGSLKRTAEFSTERSVSDIVFSVPSFWTDRQRRAFLAASKVANVDVLGLINDGTAAALSYGIWKSANNQFDADKKEYTMFVDMGQSSFQVTIAAYVQGKLSIVANTYDSNLGGRDIDFALANHFASEFVAKNKTSSPMDNPKASIKLMTACEKLKQTFTPEGVTDAPIKVEYLLEELDFTSKLDLATFNELIAPVIERVRAPLERAMEESGLSVDQLNAVEILGGSTRVRAIKEAIKETLGIDGAKNLKGLSSTQNADECISRGCALRCAMLSPAFRVKEFQVKDQIIFPISVTWEQTEAVAAVAGDKMETDDANKADSEGQDAVPVGENSIVLFDKAKEVPMTRRIIFRRRDAFEISAAYTAECSDLVPNKDLNIGSFRISGMAVTDDEVPPKIRCDFKQDEFGLFRVVKVEQMREIPDAASPEPVKADAPPAEGKEDGEAKKSDGGESKEESKPAEVKKKFSVVKLNVESVFNQGYNEAELLNARAREESFLASDSLIKATMDAKNSLEEFVYSTRDKISGDLKDYGTGSERESLQEALSTMENWLYDEGYDVEKEVYDEKKKSLVDLKHPFAFRQQEAEDRPRAADNLREEIAANLAIVNSEDEKYSHLSDEDRDNVRSACEAAEKWLNEKLGLQADKNLYEDPIVKTKDIEQETSGLHTKCRPVVTKRKPAPPKEEKKQEDPAPADESKKEEGATEGDDAGKDQGDSDKKGDEGKSENDMDVD